MEIINFENSHEAEIREKVKAIEAIHTGSEQKAQLVLLILGIKPAAELSLYAKNSTPEEAESLLQKAGLVYVRKDVEDSKIVAQYAISNSVELVEKLLQSNSSSEYGQLMGYPQTAIDAFKTMDGRYDGPLPDDIDNSIFKLIFSKDHFKEEFEVVRSWNNALMKYAPGLTNK